MRPTSPPLPSIRDFQGKLVWGDTVAGGADRTAQSRLGARWLTLGSARNQREVAQTALYEKYTFQRDGSSGVRYYSDNNEDAPP